MQLAVHERHLKLVLEVAHGAKAAHHHRGAHPPGEVGEQALERLERDAGLVAHRAPEHGQALLHGEERLLGDVDRDGHDDPVGEREAPADEVFVALSSADRTTRDRSRCASWGVAEGDGGIAVAARLVPIHAAGRPDARRKECARREPGGRGRRAGRRRRRCTGDRPAQGRRRRPRAAPAKRSASPR